MDWGIGGRLYPPERGLPPRQPSPPQQPETPPLVPIEPEGGSYGTEPGVPEDLPEADDAEPGPPQVDLGGFKAELLAEIKVMISQIEAVQGEQGLPGDTPFINAAGNWQIGDKDTGVRAQGPRGELGAQFNAEDLSLRVRRLHMKPKGAPDPESTINPTEWEVYKEEVDEVFFGRGEGITIRVFPPE